jgi:hypothetical protein
MAGMNVLTSIRNDFEIASVMTGNAQPFSIKYRSSYGRPDYSVSCDKHFPLDSLTLPSGSCYLTQGEALRALSLNKES